MQPNMITASLQTVRLTSGSSMVSDLVNQVTVTCRLTRNLVTHTKVQLLQGRLLTNNIREVLLGKCPETDFALETRRQY